MTGSFLVIAGATGAPGMQNPMSRFDLREKCHAMKTNIASLNNYKNTNKPSEKIK